MTRWKFTDSDIAILRRIAARERRINPETKGSSQTRNRMIGGNKIKFGKANGDITPDTETGSVIIWDSSVTPPVVSDPQETIDDVVFDWLSDEKISDGKEVALAKVDGLDQYRILWAECEDPDPPPVQTGG